MIVLAALAFAACAKKEDGASDAGAEKTAGESAALPDEAKTSAELAAEFEKQAVENLAASIKFLEENKNREGVQDTDSGLQYMALEKGEEDGLTPTSTDLVVFEYAASTSDGVEFDSSRTRGAAPQVRVGDLGIEVPGLAEGLQMMREGDHYRFFIPPDLAYGDRVGPGAPFGPNETLIFDVELIKVQNAARNLERAKAFLAENASKDGVLTTPSGLQYKVISEGPEDGKQPSRHRYGRGSLSGHAHQRDRIRFILCARTARHISAGRRYSWLDRRSSADERGGQVPFLYSA